MEQFIPPTTLIILYSAFSVLRFENQRWVRLIARGERGSSGFIVLFVHVTAVIALLTVLGTLALIFWNAGWELSLGLLIISFFVGLLWSVLSTAILGVLGVGDSFLVQLVATLGLLPLGYFLIRETLYSFPQ